MISRRKILSRSRDELHSELFRYDQVEEEEDTWTSKEKLYQDHIQEVMSKWSSIDDEIWAKLIVLERNRRVAKAYARAPVITVNGSGDGFDGFRIGVAGFENPMRDTVTQEVIRHIGQGVKLKMDDVGNILIKRMSKSGVRVKNTTEESAVSNDIIKLPGGLIEVDKPFKIFDMKKFQQNMNRELKRPYPDRRKLEAQCISAVAFGNANNAGPDTTLINCPVWIICINVVAIEMLRAKLPSMPGRIRPRSMEPRSLMTLSSGSSGNLASGSSSSQINSRPFASGSSDEDPYSVAGSGSSGSSGNNGNRSRSRDKPPKLPPRDPSAIYGPSLWAKPEMSNTTNNRGKKARSGSSGAKDKSGGDDPYYCGLRARIPNFVKSRTSNNNSASNNNPKKGKKGDSKELLDNGNNNNGPLSLPPQIPTHPFWWHSRLYTEANQPPGVMSLGSSEQTSSTNSGSNTKGGHYKRNPTNFVPYITDSSDSDYSHIYGRLPIPTRSGVRKFPTKPLFLSQWE